MTISSIINILDDYQTLVGSFFGIVLPVTFWYLKGLVETKKEHNKKLIYLKRYLVNVTEGVYDTRLTIEKFLKNQFQELKENVKMREDNCYSMDNAFFPFIGTDFIDYKVLSINIKSEYLDNKVALVLRNLKDLNASINDSRRQFTNTVDKNERMASRKFNLPSVQNDMYKKNLEKFEKMLNDEMLNKNIKTAIRTLMSLIIMLSEFRKMGMRKWRRKFAGTSFKYFKNKKELNEFKESTLDRIDKYFKEKIDEEIENLEKGYKKQYQNQQYK